MKSHTTFSAATLHPGGLMQSVHQDTNEHDAKVTHCHQKNASYSRLEDNSTLSKEPQNRK